MNRAKRLGMITGYRAEGDRLKPFPLISSDPDAAVWIDLLSPGVEEERELESVLGVNLPTHEDMQEIEQTSRLYTEEDSQFMTALIPAKSDTDAPIVAPVTFVLTARRLVTIRYHEPKAFSMFVQRAGKAPTPAGSGEEVMVGLLEVMIDRLADVLEPVARDIDGISRVVFAKDGAARRRQGWQAMLEEIGRKGDLISHIRDSLGTLERLSVFFGQRLRAEVATATLRDRLRDLIADIKGLTDHSNFVAQKVTFLLDATLGLIGIEQNGIIKVFSVVSVVFTPPTLVASIYGMNFAHMPELSWPYAYPAALLAMIATGIGPYLYFKARGWL
jgi:magnesium transporter